MSAGSLGGLFSEPATPSLTHSETALPKGFLASEFTFGLVSSWAAQSSFVFKYKPTKLLSPFSDPPKQTKDVGLILVCFEAERKVSEMGHIRSSEGGQVGQGM